MEDRLLYRASEFARVLEHQPIKVYELLMKTAAERATLPSPVGLHTLRHSAASVMLSAGVSLKLVSEVFGHASVAITGDIYGHVSSEVRGSDDSA